MRQAVVIPGGNHGPMAGLLAYVGQAVARRGARLELIRWRLSREHCDDGSAEIENEPAMESAGSWP